MNPSNTIQAQTSNEYIPTLPVPDIDLWNSILTLIFCRCVGVVPKWEKYWNKATEEAKSKRKQVRRCLLSWAIATLKYFIL